MYCAPSEVYITDIHKPTLQNAVYNVHLNNKNHCNNNDLNTNMSHLRLDASNQQHNNNTINNNNIISNNHTNSTNAEEYETDCIFNPSSTVKTNTDNTPLSTTIPTSEVPRDVKVSVKYVDWAKLETYPTALHATDVIVGSDLVYDDKIVNILIPALHNMLKIGVS